MNPPRMLFTVVVLCVTAGCADPLSRDNTLALHQQIIRSHHRQLSGAEGAAAIETQAAPADSYLEQNPERVKQLDELTGPSRWRQVELEFEPGLDGEASETVALTLERSIALAVAHNLDVELARLQPAISESEIVAAEAVFDAVFFTNVTYQENDRPQAVPIITDPATGTSFPVGRSLTKSSNVALETGIRKTLNTGGQLTLSTGFDYANNKTPDFRLDPDPSWSSNLLLGIEQPLLRNFGTAVNRAQIALSRNAHRRDVLSMHAQLLSTVAEVEQAYWNLYFTRRSLAIRQDLLRATVQTRDKVEARQPFDATPIQMAQAESFVKRRQREVINARQAVRNASDELKRLMHAPELPISGETLVVPIDEPIEAPVAFNLLDSVTTGLRHRPEAQQALLNIDDASIRQLVADNQRLPLLNLNAQIQYQALGDSIDQSYDRLGDGKFIEYLLGMQFEAPIGNRAAEADYRTALIARQLAVVQYTQVAEDVVQSVKVSMREQSTAYRLIGVTRSERLAAAENLRAINEQEEKGAKLTPEFLLDLKLQTQQRVAEAAESELRALVDYNIAISQLHLAEGTLLEHNRIEMQWPKRMFAD